MMNKYFYALLLVMQLTMLSGQKQFNVLLFSKTAGWHHESIKDGVDAIMDLGQKHHFNVEWQENAIWFTDEKLKNYDAIIFLNTTGDILNETQQKAMENFIRSGKGFVGIHSASDTEYDWEWYVKMVGRMFVIHPQVQTAYMNILNKRFPGMDAWQDYQLWTDEWYEFTPEKNPGLNYLITVDEKTFETKVQWGEKIGKGMGDFHPIAWYQNYDGGRSFYTAMGHLPAVFKDEKFRSHLYGGIFWAATGKGVKP